MVLSRLAIYRLMGKSSTSKSSGDHGASYGLYVLRGKYACEHTVGPNEQTVFLFSHSLGSGRPDQYKVSC